MIYLRKNFFLYFVMGSVLLLGLMSCKDDPDNVGTDIVENNIFHTSHHTAEVKAFTLNTEKNRTEGEKMKNLRLLGIRHSDAFGTFAASIVSQLSLPPNATDYGTEPAIDSVLLHIPFKSTPDGTFDDGKPKFQFQDVWTEGNDNFLLNISRLGTYLNLNDPENPSETKAYYSDEQLIKTDILYQGSTSPSLLDTMLVIKRYKYPNYPDLSIKEVYLLDTIKEPNLAPSLNIPLDKEYFTTHFLEMAESSEFASQSNFNYYFRGLVLEALEESPDNAALMKLDLAGLRVDIYYSYKDTRNEGEDEDLDGNGITGETGVEVQVPEVKHFNFGGVHFNLYNREYTNAEIEPYLTTPDITNGEDKIFVQGAAGSSGVFKVFGPDNNGNGIPDELDELKTKNWIINDAQLLLYVHPDNQEDEISTLILYNHTDQQEDPDTYLYDAYDIHDKANSYATLEKDDDGNPILYRFHITGLITEIIKPNTELQWKDLAVKTFEPELDILNSQMNEKPITEYSAEQNGVVLYGNMTAEEDKRARLIIYYTEKN